MGMAVVRALRASLIALVLLLIPALARGEAQSPCAADGCGCPHEVQDSECCCESGDALEARKPASPITREQLLAELAPGRRPSGPVLNDGRCRKTRRHLLELRSCVPSACPAPDSAPLLRAAAGAPACGTTDRPDEFEPEPSTPPPRPARV